MHVRKYLGKIYRQGLELQMELVTNEIPKGGSRDLSSHTLRNKDHRHHFRGGKTFDEFNADGIFERCYAYIDEMRLYSPGKAPILGTDKNGSILANADFLEIPGKKGGKLLASLLTAPTVQGEEACFKYFSEYYHKVSYGIERSEKKASLAKVPSTVAELRKQQALQILLSTSIDWKELKNNFKIAELVEEMDTLRNGDHGVEVPPIRNVSSMVHEDYAKLLAKYRKQVFDCHPTMKEGIIQQLHDEVSSSELSEYYDRADALCKDFYQLSDRAREMPRYNKKYDMYTVTEPEE